MTDRPSTGSPRSLAGSSAALAIVFAINTLVATPARALAGLGIVALGLPVYAYYARRLPPARLEDWMVEG